MIIFHFIEPLLQEQRTLPEMCFFRANIHRMDSWQLFVVLQHRQPYHPGHGGKGCWRDAGRHGSWRPRSSHLCKSHNNLWFVVFEGQGEVGAKDAEGTVRRSWRGGRPQAEQQELNALAVSEPYFCPSLVRTLTDPCSSTYGLLPTLVDMPYMEHIWKDV